TSQSPQHPGALSYGAPAPHPSQGMPAAQAQAHQATSPYPQQSPQYPYAPPSPQPPYAQHPQPPQPNLTPSGRPPSFSGTRVDVLDAARAIGTQIAAQTKGFLAFDAVANDPKQLRLDY